MSGSNPSPWESGSVAYLAEAVNAISYRVTFTHGAQVYIEGGGPESLVATAWDVQVKLDANAVPFGHATLKTPPTPWGTSTFDRRGSSYGIVTVKIEAGWGDDLHTLMFGYVVGSTLHVDPSNSYVEWSVDTVESVYEFPSHRTYDTSNAFTRLKQVTDAWSASSDPWYFNPVLVEGTLNTPTSAQLSSFRNCSLGIGDSVGDFLRQLAVCLGQKLTADHRADVLRMLVTAEPTWSSSDYLTLTAETYEDVEDADQWGDLLELSCQWFDSSNDLITKKRIYSDPDIQYGVFPDVAWNPVKQQAVTVSTKPPGGVMPSSYALADAWLAQIKTRNRNATTATARAAWWIKPYDTVRWANVGGVMVFVQSVTFNVDQGTMAITGYST